MNRRQSLPGSGLLDSCRTVATFLMLCSAMVMNNIAIAGEADVVDVRITAMGDGRYRIDTTVLHDDAGWDHYANRWDVLTPEGELIDSRILAHPHDTEQPFTRSLTLTIPEGITQVVIRANDSVHELGGAEMIVDVPQ